MTTFNASSRYGIAVAALGTAIAHADKAVNQVGAAGTVAFAAILAADHGMTAKTASSRIADDIPSSREKGSTFSKVRSQNVKYWSESAHVAALREAIPSPEAMTPEAFNDAVETFAKGINVRKWYDAQSAKNKEIDAVQREIKVENNREPGDDEQAPLPSTPPLNVDPVIVAETAAMKAIADLWKCVEAGHPDAQAALDRITAAAYPGAFDQVETAKAA